MDDLPDGFCKLPATEVYTNGDTIVILGIPDSENEDEESHNCDQMGCGSVGPHVIAIGTYLYGDPIQNQ